MIKIKKSPTADTRTCDWSKVDRPQLLESSKQHISDVHRVGVQVIKLLIEQLLEHDLDKINDIDGFLKDFHTGFKTQDWYDRHKQINRHHIDQPDGVRDDVNLLDVLEHVIDIATAGLARSGKVYPAKLSNELLQRALANTVDLVVSQIEVEDGEEP